MANESSYFIIGGLLGAVAGFFANRGVEQVRDVLHPHAEEELTVDDIEITKTEKTGMFEASLRDEIIGTLEKRGKKYRVRFLTRDGDAAYTEDASSKDEAREDLLKWANDPWMRGAGF